MTLLLFYISLALGVSFFCSIAEAVLLSVTPSHVAIMEQRGGAAGHRLRRLKEDIDRPLAAILSLNTIAHTVGAAGAGAQATQIFGDAYVGVISGVLTLLILVLSEIIPKTLGALFWRQLAGAVARLLVPLIWLMWPFVKMSQALTGLMARGRKEAKVSREELTALAKIGEEAGVFHEEESRILENLFRFGQLTARDIMTPRTVVFALPADRTVDEVVGDSRAQRFSRIPIYRESIDDVSGYVLKDAVLLRAALDDIVELGELEREILVLPETLSLPRLFARLVDRLEHIALVIDEHGGVAGVVTLEDVVETLLGTEIVDEADSVEDMQEMARQRWRQRAADLGLVATDEAAGGETDAASVDPAAARDAAERRRETVIRLRLTGGEPPHDEP